MSEKRCPQCWKKKPTPAFVNAAGRELANCTECRGIYRGWSKLTPEEKQARRRPRMGLASDGPVRVSFTRSSGNRKTGPIPVSMTTPNTCPPSCSFYGRGCYAEFHLVKQWWERSQRRGLPFALFCRRVRTLPPGTLWRHNEAGDLPGHGESIDRGQLRALVKSNQGRRGFTFTHKPVLGTGPFAAENRALVAEANRNGFVVNLSADSLDQADELAELAIAPVAVVTSTATSNRGTRTPAGRKVVVCPAETAKLTCLECQLCAKPQRKAIVAFRAHGQMHAEVSRLVQIRRSA